jgi:hypothetical protein
MANDAGSSPSAGHRRGSPAGARLGLLVSPGSPRCKRIRAGMRRWAMTGKQLEFTSFYAAARDDCLRIVLVTVGDRQLAEDLVAEAFTRAWESWRTVHRHPAPRAWVVRTVLKRPG